MGDVAHSQKGDNFDDDIKSKQMNGSDNIEEKDGSHSSNLNLQKIDNFDDIQSEQMKEFEAMFTNPNKEDKKVNL